MPCLHIWFLPQPYSRATCPSPLGILNVSSPAVWGKVVKVGWRGQPTLYIHRQGIQIRNQRSLAMEGCLCAESMQLPPCVYSISSMLGKLLSSTDVVLGTVPHLQVICSRVEDIGRRLQNTITFYVRDSDLQI